MTTTRIRSIDVQPLRIPFTRAFRHASAERSETETIWARAALDDGSMGSGESCPRGYVTGESTESAQEFCRRIDASLRADVVDLASAREWTQNHAVDIDQHPAAWCAVEIALLDAFAKQSKQTLEDFLSLPPLAGEFLYTAVLGDASSDAFRRAVEEYRRFGFAAFKIKLSGDLQRDRMKIATVRELAGPVATVRVDANNLWSEARDAIEFLRALDTSFTGVEEPLAANQYEQLARVADAVGCRIILDESLTRAEELARLPPPADRWIVNVRVSKMGGVLRSLHVVEEARARGIRVIVGAHVGETSVLTRVALPVARAAGDSLLGQEGAFGTRLLTRDVCDPPLMFGSGGVLRVDGFPALTRPGLGIL